MGRKRGKAPVAAAPRGWFEDSAGAQRFLWHTKPLRRGSKLLLTGNRRGLSEIAKLIRATLGERDKGATRRALAIPTVKPTQVPTALIWFRERPALARREICSIEEIELHYRKAVSPFEGFVFYRGLDLTLTDGGPSLGRAGDRVALAVRWEDAEQLAADLESSTFPQEFSRCIATDGELSLWLASDWLGVD